jgi:hypothetical protein
MKVEVKVRGEARVTRVCHICRKPIDGDPVLITREGRLLAYHADCHQQER